MARPAAGDPWQVPAPMTGEPRPRTAALTIAPDGLAVEKSVARALRDAAARLADAGWQVEEIECPPMLPAAEINATLWLAELRRSRLAPLRAEDDPDANRVAEFMFARAPDKGIDGLMDALQQRMTLMRTWDAFLDRFTVFLCPVSAEPPFPDLLDIESAEAFERVISAQLPMTALPVFGVPAMTVTTGLDDGVPIGVQLVAARYREDLLFEAGEAIASRGEDILPVNPVASV
jgi:amidase